jgi:hypothetical protein
MMGLDDLIDEDQVFTAFFEENPQSASPEEQREVLGYINRRINALLPPPPPVPEKARGGAVKRGKGIGFSRPGRVAPAPPPPVATPIFIAEAQPFARNEIFPSDDIDVDAENPEEMYRNVLAKLENIMVIPNNRNQKRANLLRIREIEEAMDLVGFGLLGEEVERDFKGTIADLKKANKL